MLSIPAGSRSASFTLTVTDDRLDELEEKITFTIGQVSSSLKTGNQQTSVITIEDNDVPVVSFAESAATRNEGSGPYTVTIQTDMLRLLSYLFRLGSVQTVMCVTARDVIILPTQLGLPEQSL
jgi:hypothetical protein